MSCRFISEAIDEIKNAFPEDWEKQYLFDTHPPEGSTSSSEEYIKWHNSYLEKSKLFDSWLLDKKENIFDKLNASVLSGEYVQVDNFEERIKAVLDCLKNITLPGTCHEIVQEFLNDKLKSNFIDALILSGEFYLNLDNIVKVHQQVDGISYITIQDYKKDKDFNEDTHYSIAFFSANCSVARYDHFLTPEENVLRNLQELDFYIGEFGANKFEVLLRHKCTFLISKWLLRKEELTKEPVNAISGGKTKQLDINSLKCKILPHWHDYIEAHYEIDEKKFKVKITSRYNKIDKKVPIEKQRIIDLHCQIKYFKDVKPNYHQIFLLRKEFERRWKEAEASKTETRNNKYSLGISYLYALNNEFSFLLKNKTKEEDNIKELYEEIFDIQEKTRLKNFFPQHRYLEHQVNLLKSIFESRKALDATKSAREIIQSCEEIVKQYQENIEWSKRNYNYVFLLPFEDCFIDIENEMLGKLYIASSFVLPLSKEKYKKDFEEIMRDFYTYKSSIEIFENLERDIKDNQNQQLRSMEIIGIFTAIVSFIATSIPAFQFISTAYQAALFMFGLACSLGVFILMIIITSRGIHKLKEHWIILASLLVSAVIAWITLIKWNPDDDKSVLKKLELHVKKMDSINYVNTKELRILKHKDSINTVLKTVNGSNNNNKETSHK